MAQKLVRRVGKRGLVEDEVVEERDSNSSSRDDVASEENTKRALSTMVTGAKPKVSDVEPADKNSIQYMAWKRKNKLKSTGL